MTKRKKGRDTQPHAVPILCRRCKREFTSLGQYLRHGCDYPKKDSAAVEPERE